MCRCGANLRINPLVSLPVLGTNFVVIFLRSIKMFISLFSGSKDYFERYGRTERRNSRCRKTWRMTSKIRMDSVQVRWHKTLTLCLILSILADIVAQRSQIQWLLHEYLHVIVTVEGRATSDNKLWLRWITYSVEKLVPLTVDRRDNHVLARKWIRNRCSYRITFLYVCVKKR